jgi:hypothetical protein
MAALDIDNHAVVTGPLEVVGVESVFLKPGETVRVIESCPEEGTALVIGLESGLGQHIDLSSLTPLDDLYKIHDYVYEGS